MYRITLLVTLILLGSCSLKNRSDLELMNINGKVRSINQKTFSINDSLEIDANYIFNESGQVVSTTNYYPTTQNKIKTTNLYNFWGRLIGQNFFSSDSLILKQVFIKIDNTKDSILAYDSKDNLVSSGILKYNENRKVIESSLYDTLKIVTYSEVSLYDTNGKLSESKINSTEPTIDGETYFFTYDSYGRLDSYSFINKAGEYVQNETYTYKSDQFDNWVEKTIVASNGNKIGIVKRELEYK